MISFSVSCMGCHVLLRIAPLSPVPKHLFNILTSGGLSIFCVHFIVLFIVDRFCKDKEKVV